MSVWASTLAFAKDAITLRDDVKAMKNDLSNLSDLHRDTRERVIRIEGLLEGAMARRLPRR